MISNKHRQTWPRAFICVALVVLAALSGTAQIILEVPPWARIVNHIYKFGSDSINPEPDSGNNAFGVPVAEVGLGAYSDGWQSPVSLNGIPQTFGESGSGSGAWDLGVGADAAIKIKIPIGDRAGAADFTAYRVRLSVTVTAYSKMVGMPRLAVHRYGLHCPDYHTTFAFDDPLLGTWTNCVWDANLISVLENDITLIITPDPNWGSIIDEVEIYALAEEVGEVTRTGMGVLIEWYQNQGLVPGEGQNWNDMDFGDADNDGALNWEEYYGGTDPHNAQSRLQITRIEAATPLQPARLEWLGGKSGSQAPYIIESAADLRDPVWEPVDTRERDTDDIYVWEGIGLPYLPRRFFRISAPNDMACPK